MSFNELATMLQNDIKVKIIVMKNMYLGLVREYQYNNYNEHYIAVELGDIPNRPTDLCGKAVGIMGRNAAAQALNAGGHSGKHTLSFRRMDHGQSVMIFYAPAVNHIRPKGTKLLPESRFQLGLVDVGRGLRHRGIAALCVNLPRCTAAAIQNS